jgi:hypothetical protein
VRTQHAVGCSENLVATGAHTEIVPQVHLAYHACEVNQEFERPLNVTSFGAASDVQEIARADDLLRGMRKKREGSASFLPEPLADFDGVNAERRHANSALAELAPLALEAP